LTLQVGQKERCFAFPETEWLRIPTLDEVLNHIPSSVAIIIEFKQDSDVLISEVLKILDEKKRKDSVFWFSLKEKINEKLRKKDESIPTIVSVQEMLRILIFYYIGILPFIRLPDSVFGITIEEVGKPNEIL
jgi:hypothetical protein